MTFDQLQLAAVSLDENPEVPQYIKGSDLALQFFSPENLILEESLSLSDFDVKHVIVHSMGERTFHISPASTSTLVFVLVSDITWNGSIMVKEYQSCLFDLAANYTLQVSVGITRFVSITPKSGRWKILTSFFPWMRHRLVENIRYYSHSEAFDRMNAFFSSDLGVAEQRELMLLDWLGHHFLGVMEQPKAGVK